MRNIDIFEEVKEENQNGSYKKHAFMKNSGRNWSLSDQDPNFLNVISSEFKDISEDNNLNYAKTLEGIEKIDINSLKINENNEKDNNTTKGNNKVVNHNPYEVVLLFYY